MALEYVEQGSTVVWEVKTAYDRIPVIFALGDPKGLKNNGKNLECVVPPSMCYPQFITRETEPGRIFSKHDLTRYLCHPLVKDM